MKIRNIFGNKYRGTLGHEMIAATWKGHDYIRSYAKPAVDPSRLQLAYRDIFSKAVKIWNCLTPRQKALYNGLAEGMTGYDLFCGRAVEAMGAGNEPEVPIPLVYRTEGGTPVPDGWLVVQHHGKPLFVDGLQDGLGEIALTPSDAPYVILIRKGTREEAVTTIEELLDTDVPLTLESEALGIRLVLNVEEPGAEVGPATSVGTGPVPPAVEPPSPLVAAGQAVSVNLTKTEAERLERLSKEHGFSSPSDFVHYVIKRALEERQERETATKGPDSRRRIRAGKKPAKRPEKSA